MPQMHVEEVQAQMKQIRETQGEEAFIMARDALVKMLIHQPRGADFLKMAFPDLDLEQYKNTDHDLPPNLADTLKAKTPHVKTQLQLQLLVTGSEAFLLAMDSLFAGNKEQAKTAIAAVMQCLDMAERTLSVAEQVAEIPPEERGQAASKFVSPSIQEESLLAALSAELSAVTTKEGLDAWYQSRRSDMDKIVNQGSRNALFDAIREKKASVAN